MAENGVGYPLLGKRLSAQDVQKPFSIISFGALSLFTVLLGFFATFSDVKGTNAHVTQFYTYYIHVALMVFVGFGFLMTFLRHFSYSAVSLNFYASCLMLLEALLAIGFMQQVWTKGLRIIQIDLPLLIDALFCAAAGMISFGALLGRVSPTQLTLVLLLEVPLYAVNQYLVADKLQALDIGGSITIHAFGAYYGLAASWALAKPGTGTTHPKNLASYTSDMTAMIGTIFLWIFWPSFNAALASNPAMPDSPQQFRCIVNTVLALVGACVAAFAASAAHSNTLNMVHIQNATLAGGVAIGSAANLKLNPAVALAVGIGAGVLSTAGYRYCTAFLESKCRVQDTCGVHNLHGMPGVLGGCVAAIASTLTLRTNVTLLPHSKRQVWFQLAGVALSVLLAILGGLAAGFLAGMHKLDADDMYEDAVWWEAEEEGDAHDMRADVL